MPRERVYGREAIVLRERDYGEADRILSLITPQGRLDAMAHGVRRIKSRKGGHLSLFSRVRLLVAQGRNLDTITQAECLEQFDVLAQDVERFTMACYAGELVDQFAQEEEPQALYQLLLDTLRWLESDNDPALGMRLFELRLLEQAGYDPELFNCLECGKELLPEVNRFSAELGGILCPHCGADIPYARQVSLGAQKVLRYMRRYSDEQVSHLTVRPVTLQELESLLRMVMQHILEREVRSGAVLDSLRRAERRPIHHGTNVDEP